MRFILNLCFRVWFGLNLKWLVMDLNWNCNWLGYGLVWNLIWIWLWFSLVLKLDMDLMTIGLVSESE
jgi:hypothetical protein